MTKVALPPDLDKVRELAQRAIMPIVPADTETHAAQNFLFTAKRTEASRELPPYYLVYFLLVDLLGFTDLGRFEKLAWSVPIDFEGTAYFIEHRKFGVGIFAHGAEVDEQTAKRIIGLIKKGVKVAQPFFRWMANNTVLDSNFNVVNNGSRLFERYQYLRGLYGSMAAEAEARKEEVEVEQTQFLHGSGTIWRFPHIQLSRNASWLALAAIDAFFAWTEHIFIHLAILQSDIARGAEIAKLAADAGT
jgi:hypothetical protein